MSTGNRPYHTMVFIRTHDGPKIHAFRHVYTPFLVLITVFSRNRTEYSLVTTTPYKAVGVVLFSYVVRWATLIRTHDTPRSRVFLYVYTIYMVLIMMYPALGL